jgi:hypothetical protein
MGVLCRTVHILGLVVGGICARLRLILRARSIFKVSSIRLLFRR